jgi:hypothetical protein
MKTNKQLLFTLATFLVIFTSQVISTNAQTAPNHIYHENTWYMITGMDSVTRAERNVVLKEYHDKVTMKNEFVLHQWSMQHFFTEDSREFVVVSEYASWEDMEKAFNRDSELEKAAWPDAKQRAEFMKKMNSYFTYHKDAIYSALPTMTK